MIPIENAKKFTDITPAETIKEEDLILLHDGTGVKSADFKKIRESLVLNIFGNPNLLDNAYFMGDGQAGNFPIDQNNNGIPDRWVLVDEYSSVEFSDNGIKIKNNSTSVGKKVVFLQYLNPIRTDVPITISVFAESVSGTWFFSCNATENVPITNAGVATITLEPREEIYTNFYIWKASSGENDYVKIQVPKIEYGRIQTVGHQENGEWVLDERPSVYQQELAKCQRCFYHIGGITEGNALFPIGLGMALTEAIVSVQLSLPVPMRIAPTVMYSGAFELVGKDASGISRAFPVVNITPDSYNSCNLVSMQVSVASGLGLGNMYLLRASNDASAFIELSAEIF